MKEIFKDINGYENLYQISNMGRVRSMGNGKSNNSKPRYLSPGLTGGYLMVVLCKNSTSKTFSVANLVANAFLLNPNNKPQINHISGIKTDNKVKNLERCTASENMKHAFKIGLVNMPNISGVKNYQSKFNEKQVKVIKHLKNIKPKMKQWEIAKLFKVSQSQISRIWNIKRYKNILIPQINDYQH